MPPYFERHWPLATILPKGILPFKIFAGTSGLQRDATPYKRLEYTILNGTDAWCEIESDLVPQRS
jgi:hypothetical protein